YVRGRATSDRGRSQSQSTSANETLSYPTSSDVTTELASSRDRETSQPESSGLNRSDRAAVIPSFPLSSSQQSRQHSQFEPKDSDEATQEVEVSSVHSRSGQSQAEVEPMEAGEPPVHDEL